MFISRETELMALQKLYDKQTFQMVVMYGRRRVGKTTLINEFIKDKPAIFFSADGLRSFALKALTITIVQK